jgi:hypothetical protein
MVSSPGIYSMESVCEPTFRKKLSAPFSEKNTNRARNVRATCGHSPKRRFTYGLHGSISQKMATFITTAVRASNPTYCSACSTCAPLQSACNMWTFSETSVHIRATQLYIPEDGNIHNYRCESLKSSCTTYCSACSTCAPLQHK